MSGGSHDYAYSKLTDIAESFDVERNHVEERKKIADILHLMSKICFIVEWIDISDLGEENWKEAQEILERITLEIKNEKIFNNVESDIDLTLNLK